MIDRYRTGGLCRGKGLRMILPVDFPTRFMSPPKKTGTATDAASVMGSFPGPITPASAGEMVVTAAAIPMVATQIRVLMHMLMAFLVLSPHSADASMLADCRGRIRTCRHVRRPPSQEPGNRRSA